MTRSLVLFDTSIYIPHLRGEAYTALLEEASRTGLVRLSAVVLGELYAGTRSARDKADLKDVPYTPTFYLASIHQVA
jgi:predicted nucleic acid-binding protein